MACFSSGYSSPKQGSHKSKNENLTPNRPEAGKQPPNCLSTPTTQKASVSQVSRLSSPKAELAHGDKQTQIARLISQTLPNLTAPNSFSRLARCLARLFLGLDVAAHIGDLDAVEKALLRSYCRRKLKTRSRTRPGSSLDDLVRQVQSKQLRQKKEYNVKFILGKVVKQLRLRFLSTVGAGTVFRNAKTKERAFYSHYFGAVARRKQVALTKFYFFKNHTHRFARIPKSVTSDLLRNWQLSPQFLLEARQYLTGQLESDLWRETLLKIHRTTKQWSRAVIERGAEAGIRQIQKSISKKGSKMPKTFYEITFAIEQIDKLLCNE